VTGDFCSLDGSGKRVRERTIGEMEQVNWHHFFLYTAAALTSSASMRQCKGVAEAMRQQCLLVGACLPCRRLCSAGN
jgi:hypothetical protein